MNVMLACKTFCRRISCLAVVCSLLPVTVLAQTLTIGGGGGNSNDVVRSYYNQKAAQLGFTQIPTQYDGAGSVAYDLGTAQKICLWYGYRSVVSMGDRIGDGRTGYTSCGNNLMGKWNYSWNNLQLMNACDQGNRWLATLVCGDPITACNDGSDNDGDGLVDLADPGCSNALDNNESDGTSQCQDHIDNDGDGQVDYPNDPGCTSKLDYSERGGACDDGVDNDADGKVDYPADPGCTSLADSTETGQCGDGIDNDGDGAVDAGADFSCTNKDDNDETNPKAQCQDGLDNDGDGATDYPADPGCTSKQDNSEKGTAQCDNGIDDDADGKVDYPADPGCTGPGDSSEKGLCGDGIDNDSDGATDYPNDFSCSSTDDNDETNPKAQCQDGIDNDGDGTVDLADPGCSNKQDNSETDAAGVLPMTECVFNNFDGTYTAYFGYENTGSADIVIALGSNGSAGTNAFSGTVNRGQPTNFKAGRVKGAFSVSFDGNAISWTVQRSGSASHTAVASRTSQACAPVTPIMECIDFVESGGYTATFGYQNDNPFPIKIPVGALNRFFPTPEDRGQPASFLNGRVSGGFLVPFPEGGTLDWGLNGQSAEATESSPLCPTSQGCTNTPITNTKSELDKTALTLANATKKAATMLEETVMSQSNSSRSPVDAARARKKADAFLAEARRLAFLFPDVVKSCPNAPQACAQIDNKTTIDALDNLYVRQWAAVRRILARSEFRKTGTTTRVKKLVVNTRTVYKSGRAALVTIPRFATDCD